MKVIYRVYLYKIFHGCHLLYFIEVLKTVPKPYRGTVYPYNIYSLREYLFFTRILYHKIHNLSIV